jgi:hypothetical protein
MKKQTAEAASLTNGAKLGRRSLPGEVAYPLSAWLKDALAGRRDAKLLAAMLDKAPALAVTPWMEGQTNGLMSAVSLDRRQTTAAQAPLRQRAAALVSRHAALGAEAADLRSAAGQAANQPVSDTPATAGEAHETPEQIRRRRQRERDAEAAAAQQRADACQGQLRDLVAELAQLREAHDFLETCHRQRKEALRDYYTKRQAVYVRWGLRGSAHDGLPPAAPPIVLPDWPAEPFPAPGDAAVSEPAPGGE